MARTLQSYRKPQKTKCNLLQQIFCCFNNPEFHTEGDNVKKNTNLKIKKPKCKFWKRVRSWLTKPESKIETFNQIKMFKNENRDINRRSVISVDDNNTPEIEGNVTVHRRTIGTNTDDSENKEYSNRSMIYKSIFEGNVTVHRMTIYANNYNSESSECTNENMSCLHKSDTESEKTNFKSTPHQIKQTDLASIPLHSRPMACMPVEYNLTTTTVPYHSNYKLSKNTEQWDLIENKLTTFFQSLPNAQASIEHFDKITKLCDCPLYMKGSLYIACGGKDDRAINMSKFIKYWKDVWSSCSDLPAIFVRVLAQNSTVNFLTCEDFKALVMDVICTHPGLRGLKSAPNFHYGYMQTVIACIFYDVDTSWSGKISVMEIRQSKLMAVIYSLEHEDTMQKLPNYFNYEQYFVIEHIFWKLDRNRYLTLDINDLSRYNQFAISKRMLKRIFSNAVLMRGEEHNDHDEIFMDYWDFVWFIKSDEDKIHTKAIEYWFRCMDLNGDGYLSLSELEFFYNAQLDRLEAMKMEGSLPPFKKLIPVIINMIKPKWPKKISLTDLKTTKMTNLFFDTFFNIVKYLKYDEFVPYESLCEPKNTNDKSEWELFVEEQYTILTK